MRKPLVVGIIKETRYKDERAPLTPSDVAWLRNIGIEFEVETSAQRIFKDYEYERAGAKIVKRCRDASLLIGIKEPVISSLQPNKIYMVFSHTIKGQSENMPLLRAFMNKKITLIDYERIRDKKDNRQVYFGRFAGICGTIDSLCFYGRKLLARKVKNPFSILRPANFYQTYMRAKETLRLVAEEVKTEGFDERISPFIIGLTGHGNAGGGVLEALKIFKPTEIHPKDLGQFIVGKRWRSNKIYQIVFNREEKLRRKDQKGFYFEQYLKKPHRFESNMERYLPYLNILIHCSFWNRQFPRLVTKEMIQQRYTDDFRLKVIGDISCDIKGSIEITNKATTPEKPVYTYNPKTQKYKDGYASSGITILARNNLPSEFPLDSSLEFSDLIREYIYQIATHGAMDVTRHVAIPREIRDAVITQSGRLTRPYVYLKKYLQ